MTYAPQVGAWIREHRKRLGWQVNIFAQKAKLSVATVANAERGRLTSVTFGAITRALQQANPQDYATAVYSRPPIAQKVVWQPGEDAASTGMVAESPLGIELIP